MRITKESFVAFFSAEKKVDSILSLLQCQDWHCFRSTSTFDQVLTVQFHPRQVTYSREGKGGGRERLSPPLPVGNGASAYTISKHPHQRISDCQREQRKDQSLCVPNRTRSQYDVDLTSNWSTETMDPWLMTSFWRQSDIFVLPGVCRTSGSHGLIRTMDVIISLILITSSTNYGSLASKDRGKASN